MADLEEPFRRVLTKKKRNAKTYWADRGCTQLLSVEQVRLVLSDLLRSELLGLQKMLGELTDDSNVGCCGTMRVIAALEFLHHLLSKLGHRDLLFYDPTYLNPLAFTRPDCVPLRHALASAAQRLLKSQCHSLMPENVRGTGARGHESEAKQHS